MQMYHVNQSSISLSSLLSFGLSLPQERAIVWRRASTRDYLHHPATLLAPHAYLLSTPYIAHIATAYLNTRQRE